MRRFALLAGIVALSASAAAQTRLRYDSYLVFRANQGETVPIVVESVGKAKFVYKDAPHVIVLDPGNHWVLERDLPLGKRSVIDYAAPSTGLHAACIKSGSNLVVASVEGRPWAVVARAEAPVNISGRCDAWHFAPPAGLAAFTVYVHANVKGEAAIVRITDPDGKVAVTQEDDFDKATALKVKVAGQTEGRPWQLEILDPGKPKFALDDVTIWLGRELQPLLCAKAEWLAEFRGVSGEAPEKISQRIVISAESIRLPKRTQQTLRFELKEIPAGKIVALRVRATDIDYGIEAPATLNGLKLFLPVTGDGITADVTVAVPRGVLKVGENVLELSQDPSGGSGVYSVHRAELLFGDAINCE